MRKNVLFKKIAGITITMSLTVAMLAACANTNATQNTSPDQSQAVTEQPTPDADANTNTQEQETNVYDFNAVMDAIAGIEAGSSGCSLRAESAAQVLSDYINAMQSEEGNVEASYDGDKFANLVSAWVDDSAAKGSGVTAAELHEDYLLLQDAVQMDFPDLPRNEMYLNICAGIESYAGASGEEIDPQSLQGQLITISNSTDLWYMGPSDGEDIVRYAVTDMDENGRLELIASDYNEETCFSKNRFYEITEDFSGMYKMDCEIETMWLSGETSGYSPDIMGQEYVECYMSEQWGNKTDDYAGPSYFYLFMDHCLMQDSEIYDGWNVITELTFSNKGKVGVWFYGMEWLRKDGTIEYTDQSGIDTDEEGMWYDARYAFQDGDYVQQTVHIAFKEIPDASECVNILTESQGEFSRVNSEG